MQAVEDVRQPSIVQLATQALAQGRRSEAVVQRSAQRYGIRDCRGLRVVIEERPDFAAATCNGDAIGPTNCDDNETTSAVYWLWKEWANVLRLRNGGVPILGFTWNSPVAYFETVDHHPAYESRTVLLRRTPIANCSILIIAGPVSLDGGGAV